MTTPTMNLDCDGFADALADYLEGDASDGVRSAVEAHASSCAACRQLLSDLTAIRTDAEALPLLTPSRDLWTGIAERIDARVIPMEAPQVARDIPRRWLRPAVAAAALVVVTAGITHVLTRASITGAAPAQLAVTGLPTRQTPEPVGDATATIASTATERPDSAAPVKRAPAGTSPAVRLVSARPAMDAADPVFASEISKLRRIVRDRRDQLDPKTVAVLEQSIAVIDSAIAQSRAALTKDPASGFLATQLNHSLEKKVELLRTAALLPSRT
ncbi:MAG: hypothetical protein JWL61_3245 [Gemmatimonadetes bacterium]|nr:hypothetical protein [Gemmatimonadota bacterium]